MSTAPFRPLPVGGVPAWLLGQLIALLQPLHRLASPRLQYGAELTHQGKAEAHHVSIALQLGLIATAPPADNLTNIASKVTEACGITVPSSFRLLPVGGPKGITTPTVSAPNRSKRGNCCSARNPYGASRNPKPVAGFARHRPPDGPDVSRCSDFG